jgi:hypothetical protein
MSKLDFGSQPKLKPSNDLEHIVDKAYIQYAVDAWQAKPPNPDFEDILKAEAYYPPDS